jgi:hypothetical protein
MTSDGAQLRILDVSANKVKRTVSVGSALGDGIVRMAVSAG